MPVHTYAEVVAALEGLTDNDLRELLEHARYLNWHRPMDAEDLFQEAVRRTLTGSRRWYKRDGNPVAGHLCGVMRSIADNDRASWWETIRRNSVTNVPDMDGEADESSAVNRLRAQGSTPDEEIAANEAWVAIMNPLAGDDLACRVMTCRCLGMSETEIAEALEISMASFEATRKRISRKVGLQGGRVIDRRPVPLSDDERQQRARASRERALSRQRVRRAAQKPGTAAMAA